MSICDNCFVPGFCCRSFTLFNLDDTERTFWMSGDGTVAEFIEQHQLPFEPQLRNTIRDEETGRDYGEYSFSCPQLGEDGRCKSHDDRPEICRRFEPAGGSPLCVHSYGAEGTGDGL